MTHLLTYSSALSGLRFIVTQRKTVLYYMMRDPADKSLEALTFYFKRIGNFLFWKIKTAHENR